jgi:3,4-dihydroxy 2-butanone 4-phosphate synthase / GTP cyclohydrolase II
MSKIAPLPTRATEGAHAGSALSSIEEILEELRAGRMVVMLDDEERENEGDLIMAAQFATAESVAFMIRHTSGIICVSMDPEQLARLDLPQMVPNNDEAYRTAFTVSVDYRFGTTTGVSSGDRAATIRALVDPASSAADFARPGHIFPLRPRRGGVLIRAGHTEAAMDLCMLAGLKPAGVLCELMNDDGSMARRRQIEAFARTHALKIGTIAELIRHRLRHERSIERLCEQSVQTEFGEFRLVAYQDRVQRGVHLALVSGTLDENVAPLVRVHVADTLRDLLGIRGDTRAWTLRAALERVAQSGSGIVVILREPEDARDLTEALRSLVASPAGAVPSTSAGDKPPETSRAVLRTYGIGAQILKDLGVRRMRVLSAPKQMHGLSAFGLEVESYLGDDT